MKGRPPILEHPNVNAGPDRTAIDGEPPCPASIKGPALKIWKEMIALLSGAGTLTKLDGPILKRYCVIAARLDKAERAITREGAIRRGKGRRGIAYQNPQLFVANKCIDQLESLGKLLGIDRASRKKMGIETKRAKSGLSVRDRSKSALPPQKGTGT
jgi:P27 family predicted phage terminase small subunit